MRREGWLRVSSSRGVRRLFVGTHTRPAHRALREALLADFALEFDVPPMAVRSTPVGTAVFEDGILTGARIDPTRS